MSKIAEFLTKFDDQHLANLQCAAEDGSLVYFNCDTCLLHHIHGNYTFTKWEWEEAALAKDAETEYRLLGPSEIFGPCAKEVDDARRTAILPLIQAEWTNRIKAIEELTPVSLSVR